MTFKSGALIETINSNNLPLEIKMEYFHEKTKLIHNATNSFISISDNQTLYETELIVKKYPNLLMKIIMTIFAMAGRKFTQKQLDDFKIFAEKRNLN